MNGQFEEILISSLDCAVLLHSLVWEKGVRARKGVILALYVVIVSLNETTSVAAVQQ
jgi:hypothetical protein